MIVGGLTYAGVSTRPALAPSGVTTAAASSADETRQTNPTYFRSISSISYGSLASAYHSIRSLEAANTVVQQAHSSPAILSGIGIPAALDAYSETMETAEI